MKERNWSCIAINTKKKKKERKKKLYFAKNEREKSFVNVIPKEFYGLFLPNRL
jgi:hypothetical protein